MKPLRVVQWLRHVGMPEKDDQGRKKMIGNKKRSNGPEKKSRIRNFREALNMELREHRSSFIVYFTLRALVILVLVLQLINRNYENVFLCGLTLLLLIVPSLLQITFKVELPTTLEIIILVFIFAAEILGEINEFYLVFPFWDTALHTLNGFLAAAIGFSLVDLLNRSERTLFNLSPLFTAIVAFCFSMTIGVLWEFFEFGMDQLAGYDMQKDTVIHVIRSVTLDPAGHNVPYEIRNITDTAVNGQELGLGGYLDIGLIDTMQDLIVNFAGAVVFSVLGFFYVKNRGKGRFAGKFIPRRKSKDRDFLKIAGRNADYGKKENGRSVSGGEDKDGFPDKKNQKSAENCAENIK